MIINNSEVYCNSTEMAMLTSVFGNISSIEANNETITFNKTHFISKSKLEQMFAKGEMDLKQFEDGKHQMLKKMMLDMCVESKSYKVLISMLNKDLCTNEEFITAILSLNNSSYVLGKLSRKMGSDKLKEVCESAKLSAQMKLVIHLPAMFSDVFTLDELVQIRINLQESGTPLNDYIIENTAKLSNENMIQLACRFDSNLHTEIFKRIIAEKVMSPSKIFVNAITNRCSVSDLDKDEYLCCLMALPSNAPSSLVGAAHPQENTVAAEIKVAE